MRLSFGMILLVSQILMSGCTLMQRQVELPLAPTTQEDYFTEIKSEYFKTTQPIAAWWQYFNDAQMTELIEEALAYNLEARSAVLRVHQARASTTSQKLTRFPRGGIDADYTAERISLNNSASRRGSAANRDFDTYDGAVNAIWETDLFGRLSYRIDQQEALLGQKRADLYGVYISVASETAKAYLELRGTQQQLAIDRKNETNQARTYELTQTLGKAGKATTLDIQRALTQLELTRATIAPLEALIQNAIYRLSVLTGKLPDALEDSLSPIKPLPNIEASAPIGDPVSLLRRRPDILRAEFAIEEALAQYNLATADLFPEVTLMGSVGFASSALTNLLTSDSLRASVSPSISWRLLELYRVKKEIDQADYETQARLLDYEQTVLNALHEIKSTLQNYVSEENRHESLVKAARASAEASRIARERYEAGLDDFLDILDAERTQLATEDSLSRSETNRTLYLVDIYKALGGGWEVETHKA